MNMKYLTKIKFKIIVKICKRINNNINSSNKKRERISQKKLRVSKNLKEEEKIVLNNNRINKIRIIKSYTKIWKKN